MSQTFSLQKSREELKRQGYDTDITEMPFNPYTKRRKDLWGFCDILAMLDDGTSTLVAVQGCGEDVGAHISKLLKGYVDKNGKEWPANPHLPLWLKKGHRFFVWSWCLRGARGKRKLYRLREIEFTLENGIVTTHEIPHDEPR